MAEEGTVVPGEGQGESLSPNVEIKARAKGWKPLEDYSGPEGEWIDAKEFVGRQPLYDQIHSLKREISKQGQSFQKEMGEISAHFAKMQQVEFDKAVKQLKNQKALAAEDRDIAAVEAINDEIKEKEKEFEALKKETPKPQVPAQTSKEFNEWRETNKWFDSDKELQREAIAIGTGYAITNPNLQQTDVLEYVEKRIRKIYPEKFGAIFKEEKMSSDNKVESGGITAQSGLSNKKSKGLTTNDLDDQERSVMKTLIKRGALQTKATANKISQEEQYLRDLSEAKGLR